MRKRLVRMIVAVAAVGLAAGCSSGSDSSSGTLDPCRQIGDDAVRAAGFEPSTKLVKDDVPGSPAHECTFTAAATGMLRIDLYTTGNTYDHLLTDAQSRAATNGRTPPELSKINGRDTFTHPEEIIGEDKSIPLGCSTTLRTATGALKFTVLPHAEDLYRTDDACKAVTKAAQALEPTIGTR
ncbi:DUF3558 family protein [Nocardia sp. CDC153]|uniref:DUF3558 family protein n=1 Tax=Nocardia sp. CDC153 TaxID=3112167 RepID=UPI002DB961A1|nr:DUF3558 family protein [Nocardia sp. CDC153]MEC3953809.1 DUF3558 family protein [Nocardia sp. CDC153]